MTTSSSESPRPASNPDSEPFSSSTPNLKLLGYAWERFNTYNDNASQAQKRFFFVRGVLAYLSVFVVFLSVLQPVILIQVANLPDFDGQNVADVSLIALFGKALEEFRWVNPETWLTPWSWIGGLALVDFLLILLPIMATGLLAFAVKFDRGNNWILLRGNSESLKMEIFHYRTRTKQYKHNRNSVLAERIQLISERIKGSAVHQSALSPYEGQPSTRLQRGILILLLQKLIDFIQQSVHSLFSFFLQFREIEVPRQTESDPSNQPLDAAQQEFLELYADLDAATYIRYRLEDQFNWYRRKAKAYDRDYQILQTSVYFFGGVGTLLAAVGFQNWVALSTALATALASYLEYKRVEATLVGYNQAADTLYDIRAWWYSISPDDRAKIANFEKLVVSTEETIRSEHTSWLQDMQDRLANLYGDAGEEDSSDGEPEGTSTPNDSAIEIAENSPGVAGEVESPPESEPEQ